MIHLEEEGLLSLGRDEVVPDNFHQVLDENVLPELLLLRVRVTFS